MSTSVAPPKFQVGQKVMVVDEPYMECPLIWISSMSAFCGMEATITRADYMGCGIYRYLIDLDRGLYNWCENCFVDLPPEIDDNAWQSIVSGGFADG